MMQRRGHPDPPHVRTPSPAHAPSSSGEAGERAGSTDVQKLSTWPAQAEDAMPPHAARSHCTRSSAFPPHLSQIDCACTSTLCNIKLLNIMKLKDPSAQPQRQPVASRPQTASPLPSPLQDPEHCGCTVSVQGRLQGTGNAIQRPQRGCEMQSPNTLKLLPAAPNRTPNTQEACRRRDGARKGSSSQHLARWGAAPRYSRCSTPCHSFFSVPLQNSRVRPVIKTLVEEVDASTPLRYHY